MHKNVFIYTYGCQMNVHDSEKMLGSLARDGYSLTDSPELADLVIFNTCAIRDKAEQKFYSQLGRTRFLKRKRPGMQIAVAGCVAQSAQRRILKRAPYVDFIIGPQNIMHINDLISSADTLQVDDNPNLATEQVFTARESNSRAWVSIMFGCNNYCTYCIVPYTRGREISRPSAYILDEISRLRSAGYLEVTLLGQNVNSYRSDLDFIQLLRSIGQIGIERIRFVTSHPRDLTVELATAMAEIPSVCEHIHLPLQSGSDRLLQSMNRSYTVEHYRELVRILRMRVPGIAITTDIIVGFPGETDDDFEATTSAVKEIRFDGVFAFKYSRRPGTKAAIMGGQVPDSIKSERLNRLLRIQEDITLQINTSLVGTAQEILLEGPSETAPDLMMGRTRSNKIVTVQADGLKEGDLRTVVIRKARHHSLAGEVIALPSL